MKNLILLMAVLISFSGYGQSTLGKTFKIKGKSTSNEAYINKQQEVQLMRNIRLKENAQRQLEAMRKRESETAARRQAELINKKCGVQCTDQTVYFTCNQPAPKCLNGEAANIIDPNGLVIGTVEPLTKEESIAIAAEGSEEVCILSCSTGEKLQYKCNAVEKPKCQASICKHTCPNGVEKQYYCNSDLPVCEGSPVVTNTSTGTTTTNLGSQTTILQTTSASTPGQCVGEDFQCGYFQLNTCNTGGFKQCPSSCDVKCPGGTYKQLCRLKPISCDLLEKPNVIVATPRNDLIDSGAQIQTNTGSALNPNTAVPVRILAPRPASATGSVEF